MKDGMEINLVSISELAELSGEGRKTIEKKLERGLLKPLTLTRSQALSIGLRWPGVAGPPRHFISIDDPAVPARAREKYYELKASERSGSPPSHGNQREGSPNFSISCLPRPGDGIISIAKEAKKETGIWLAAAGGSATPRGPSTSPPDARRHTHRPQAPINEEKTGSEHASLNSPGDGARSEGLSEALGRPPGHYEIDIYGRLPDWAKKQVDKYLPLVRQTEGLSAAETAEALAKWNRENPDLAMSSSSLARARRLYRERGIEGLASRRGVRSGHTIVREEWYEYFKSLYLKEGAPSAETCWLIARGKFSEEERFPVAATFSYQLRRRVPADAIFLARHGEAAWNRKYGRYIERDYSNILSGEVWVSDHAQVDVAVADPDGKPFFPWVTAWRDMKSGKWLGWLVHRDPPKAAHVFQSFYYACRDHGIPKHIYIDNGKDYRARDFAGGREKKGKLKVDERRARSVCAALEIDVHFALPYNAQAKNIERDFLKQKETFSKHMPGYRGGHSKERPEALAAEIRGGKILPAPDFGALLSAHIFHNLNRAPSRGKVLRGLCPDELYEREADNAFVPAESLSILCMRVSGSRAIGRNGVRDSRSGETYFAEWMAGQKTRKVYLRRDPASPETAWVFCARTDEYLGRGFRVEAVPAIVIGDAERERLSAAMADKRAARKIAKSYASDVREIPPLEKVANMAVGNAMLSGYAPGGGQKKKKYTEHPLTEAVRERESLSALDGAADYSAVAPPRREPRRTIYMTEADREREEDERKLLEEELRNEST